MDDKKQQKKEETLGQNEVHEEAKVEESKENVLLQQLEDINQKYKRALADYQNLVRRTQEEKMEWAKLSNKELILKLLPILDTLMLAEKHTKDQTFALTVQQFLQVLSDDGVKRIKTEGEFFDPLVMEAVETRTGEDHKVLEEVKAGFRSGDIIIRPAYVIVGRKEEN